MIPFGKYLLLERIAVGGMAEVYLAKSFGIEGFEKLLAIKRILPTMAEDQDFIEMFIDEAKIAGQLTHANVVPIFELGKIGESHYIAMEYVWGKDLLQIMNRFRRLRKRMPAPMVAWVATRMCEALDYAHNKRDRRGHHMGIIHRDVSPQNILVSYEGEVKIIDFGIAKAASRTTKTQAGVLKGKFGYMSPEQVRGLPIDHRSDIFAVGTCMYEALTSERLFLGESDFSTLEKVRNADVAPVMEVAQVPGELNEVVMKALRRDPGDRYQTAAELQEALHRFLAKQRPPFGTSKLSAWLKTAFSTEMAREKARLDSFATVGRPSVLGGRRPQPSLSRTVDERPATRRPPPREPVAEPGPSSSPPLPRPAGVQTTDELSDDDLSLASVEDDLEAEATMVSSSPFEDIEGAAEEQEITEEPTQIFFSADDLEEVNEDEAIPAGGIPSDRPPAPSPGPVAATFRKGQAPEINASNRPGGSPAAAPLPVAMPPRGAMPPRPSPAGGNARPTFGAAEMAVRSEPLDPSSFGAGGQGATGPASMKPEPTPVFRQRQVPTMELSAAERDAAIREAERRKGGSRAKTIALAAVAATLMLGVGVLTALLLFGGDEVGTVEIRTVPSVGATVRIDDVPRGRAPLRVERMQAGRRTIVVEAEGYEPERRSIDIFPDSTALMEIALRPATASPPVAQAASEAPGGAEGAGAGGDTAAEGAAGEQAEGGSDEAEAAARAEAEAEAEREAEEARAQAAREAEAAAAREAATQRRAEQRAEAQASVREEPRRPRATEPSQRRGGTGTLAINTIPWARVFIDGRDTRRNTPIPSMRVRAGTRTIGLRTPDGQTHEFQVEVTAGETVRLSKRL